ncbi:MAG: TIR domain-containing protein [Candidatus Brocadia sp.]
MAGGSSTFSFTSSKSVEEAGKLIRNAVEVVERNVPEERPVRNVFISFHVEDEAQVNLLRSQAKREQFGIEFRDYSVKEPFDEKWKQQVRERIALCSATIVMIGPDTAKREAVLWEIEESYRQGKKVIGIRIYGDRNDPIPRQMQENGAPIVNWKMEEIRAELDRE